MQLPSLTSAILIRRYKRFLADVEIATGEILTVHCPNTGAMTGLAEAGMPVWLSHHHNPKRKLAWTWELVETPEGIACIHSARANAVVDEALSRDVLPELSGFTQYRREVRYGKASRADFCLDYAEGPAMLEVKAVTLLGAAGQGLFPDAVSSRALRHLNELEKSVLAGGRSALVFCSLHTAIERFAPAAHIDPHYAKALQQAVASGVEVYGMSVTVTPESIEVSGRLILEGIT